MKYLRELYHRFIAWCAGRPDHTVHVPIPDFVVRTPTLGRDVSATGVRFYSLCGSCGSPLAASATLCDACASQRTESREPWT
jgi:hypothetical protein